MYPPIIFLLAGLAGALGNDKLRRAALVAGPVAATVAMFNLPIGTDFAFEFVEGYTTHLMVVDHLAWFFGMAFCIHGTISGIFSCHNKSWIEAVSSMSYIGTAVGVVLAGDWITFLFCWEAEAVSSVFLIWADARPTSQSVGLRYLLMHTLSGNCLLLGIVGKLVQHERTIVNLTNGPHDILFWMILLGILINVAMIPLHGWLVEGYPAATITGGVFMNSCTTKVAIYAMLRIFGGTELLIVCGVIMALYGALYAVMENDMARLLSYHVISQLGYMAVGAGIGTAMAMNAAAAHAFNNIIYKTVLFMCCAAITYATGIRKINQLGGMGKRYPYIFGCFMIGALSIAGMPLFSGFVSKLMVVAAAEELHLGTVALLLELASIGTFLSITFKMAYFIFLAPDKGIAHEQRPIEPNMKVAIAIGSAICVLVGIFPQALQYNWLPYGAVSYVPYTMERVCNQLVMLCIAVIPFLMFLPRMEPHTATSLDTDWFLRRPFKGLVAGFAFLCFGLCRSLGQAWGVLVNQAMMVLANPMQLLDARQHIAKRHYSPENYRFVIGDTIMIALTVLFICIYYFQTHLLG